MSAQRTLHQSLAGLTLEQGRTGEPGREGVAKVPSLPSEARWPQDVFLHEGNLLEENIPDEENLPRRGESCPLMFYREK